MAYCDWRGDQSSILCLSLPRSRGRRGSRQQLLNVSLYGWYGLNNSTGSVKTSSDAIGNNAHISPLGRSVLVEPEAVGTFTRCITVFNCLGCWRSSTSQE